MKRSSSGIYNSIAGLFAILTLISCACIGGLLAHVITPPPAFSGQKSVILPTNAALPTDTKTYTPSATFTATATFTPSATNTPTDTPIPTDTPTDTPTVTPIASDTPIPTLTLFPSRTPSGASTVKSTAAASGTAATPAGGNAAIAFAPDPTSPQYSANPDPTTGCKVQVIAGQILDLNNTPITSKVEVFIFGPNNYKKLARPISTNVPPYGIGFWVLVIPQFNSNAYTVEVLNTSKEVQISTPATVQFSSDCQKNVAIVNFNQIKPTTLS